MKMKIYREANLRHFEFWAGAKQRVEKLTSEELDQLQEIFEDLDLYPDGLSETDINDIFWFEEDWIAELLGFESWDEIEAR